ncbi:Ig-like domain-containing protein [Pyxidicoccus sp. MSG2]|uniref:Ig-like domain-containing protein n=1 Tax=Pyxidicoccus sp. MSG2 TaxID=2996790 RepID=UPI00226D60B5|nr:Ig-like domain-containing protein [Pyxidicoccus sp. MSG2]MCY1016900.1 Ig-like domain-containing protein [Pyxidicoccus sp. MSG2]
MTQLTLRALPRALLASLVLLLAGCDEEAFTLLYTDPYDGDTGVSRMRQIAFVFNQEVDFPPSQPPEVSISPEMEFDVFPTSAPLEDFDIKRVVVVIPLALLAPDTEYTVTVRARSVDGESLSEPARVRFVTGREPNSAE